MKKGTKCPTKTIHWQENAKDIVHEFFEDGTSKGLLILGRELGLLEPNRKYKLQDLRLIIQIIIQNLKINQNLKKIYF